MKSNAELIALAKNGSQDALEQIYTENANKVYFLCLKLLKNSEDASDVMQDTFVKAFSNLEQLKNPDALTSWLISIATSLCKNLLLKNKKYIFVSDNEEDTCILQNIEDTDDTVLPEQYVDNAEKRRLVMDIIDRLPDGQRIAIILFYYNGMSIKEIADVLECSAEAVKSRLYYARKTIKEEVLKLEKNDTKLYGVSVIPLLGNILNYEAINTPAPTVAAPFTSSLAQTAQTPANLQTAAALTRAAATGGKVMSTMTKIIIAALAAVVVAGGAITAVVIANNNNNSSQSQELVKNSSSDKSAEDKSSKKDNKSSEQPNQPSSQDPQSEPTSNEEPQKSEFEQIAENMTAHYISSNILSAEDLEIKNDYGPDKYTVLTFMLTLPEGPINVNNSLGATKYPIICDKNGEKLRSSLSSFIMNDGSSVYIAVVDGEYAAEDMNIKLYASFQKKTCDIKEFDRSEAELQFASGKVQAGDFVKINGKPYVYAGLQSSTTGTRTEGDDIHYQEFYHWFVSLTSEPTDNLTSDLITKDDSATASLEKSEHPIDSSLDINDSETLSVIGGNYHKKLYEGIKATAGITLPKDTNPNQVKEYKNKYLWPYIEALQIAYNDPDSDYSFNINFDGKKDYSSDTDNDDTKSE